MQETHIDSENEAVRVLFVEDDPIDRRLVERILCPCLKPVQFTVSSAESLAEAAESLKDKEYDVVLLDLGLPDSDGIETLQAIAKKNPHIPIVVLTGLNDEDTGLRAIENGATDYLAKELPLNMLLVRTILLAIQRKKTEQKARIMARFPQENPNPVLRISKARKILDANSASSPLLKKCGCQVGECLPEIFCEGLYETLTSGKVCILDFGWQDGRIFLLTFVPVTEEDYVNVYGMDVTDHRKAEDNLQLFRSLIEQSSDGVFMVDAATGRFLLVNNRACSTLGYEKEELLNMTVPDIETTLPGKAAWQEQLKVIKSGEGMILAHRHKRKDQTTFPVEVSAKFVQQGGKEYIVGVGRDLSEREQTEKPALQTSHQEIPA